MSRPAVGIALGILSLCAMLVAGNEKSDSGKSAAPEARSGAVLFPPGQSVPAAGPRRFGQIGRGTDFRSIVMGTADVFGKGPYDLFLLPDRLFPFRGFDDDGTPMYGAAVITKGQPMHGVIMTGEDRAIYGVFGEGKKVRVCKFDRATLTFEPFALSGDLDIPGGIGVGIASYVESAGKLHVYFSIADTTEYRPAGDHHAASYMPYDGAGFWRGKIPRRILYHARFDTLKMERIETVYRVGKGDGEFLFDQMGMAIVHLGDGRPAALVTSEKQSVMRYFPIDPKTGKLGPQQFVNNEEHVALRHPVINVSVRTISDPKTGHSNLVVGDTGRIWFTRFSGEFSPNGSPIYRAPRPIKAEGVHLTLGELPVISPGDIDKDGLIDFIVGNDAGQLLFVKNIGTAKRPEFDNPVPVPAGGRPLDIKGGYRGSIQGPGEAMWGYTCPTLCDWNGDGQRDVILNSIMADYMVLLGQPSNGIPAFSEPKLMYCDGLQLHLAWRSQPGITDWGLGGRLCMIALDEQNLLRRFWRIDNQNVERGELLRLQDGSTINANIDEAAGQTGRAKLVPYDWDRDGAIDLMIGTSRGLSFPASPTIYYPSHYYPEHQASVLLMRNAGTNKEPVFEYVRCIEFNGKRIGLGIHSCSPAPIDLGRGVDDLFVGEENGSIHYYPRESLSVSPPAG